ncbi:MAG: hypothetical protein V4541_09535 [Bacteroidota bacterium]
MEKQPFTTEGVLALQNWLYNLSNAELEAEVLAMKANFTGWVLTYLLLDETQLAYFDNMSATPMEFLAFQTTFAVANRRPINLMKQAPKNNNALFDDKLFEPESKLAVTSHSNGSYEVSGELNIEVSYIN